LLAGCDSPCDEKRGHYTKKKVTRYREADPKRREEYLKEIALVSPENIAYVDETGVEQENFSNYGYAMRGEKIEVTISGKRQPRINIVSGKQGDKIIGTTEYSGTMKAPRFETWFSLFFLPLLIAGTVIVMDNAKFHRKTMLYALAESHGCKIIFLPAYSPDLNPIENLWANLKTFLRNHSQKYATLNDAFLHFFQIN